MSNNEGQNITVTSDLIESPKDITDLYMLSLLISPKDQGDKKERLFINSAN